jgi:hypothetical protein
MDTTLTFPCPIHSPRIYFHMVSLQECPQLDVTHPTYMLLNILDFGFILCSTISVSVLPLWCDNAWLRSQHSNLLLLSYTQKTDAVYSPETLVPSNVATVWCDSESCVTIRDILKALMFYFEFLFKYPPLFSSQRPVSRFTAQSNQPISLSFNDSFSQYRALASSSIP